MISTTEEPTTPTSTSLTSLCHDLDHRGTNNSYQHKSHLILFSCVHCSIDVINVRKNINHVRKRAFWGKIKKTFVNVNKKVTLFLLVFGVLNKSIITDIN